MSSPRTAMSGCSGMSAALSCGNSRKKNLPAAWARRTRRHALLYTQTQPLLRVCDACEGPQAALKGNTWRIHSLNRQKARAL